MSRITRHKIATREPDKVADSLLPAYFAAPFVKWAGGKRSIISILERHLPREFKDYYEPFVGGGALFFHISQTLDGNAYLSDVNEELIAAYQVIQKEPDALLRQLAFHAERHSEEYYYTVRATVPKDSPVATAARFIYLNKTCFNGLYRVNAKGLFNVPSGKRAVAALPSQEHIENCSAALANASIRIHPYDAIKAKKGDFVYFDPPYDPISKTATFTAYSADGFGRPEQERLRDFCVKLDRAGVRFMLSNSNTAFIRDLYADFKIRTIEVPRLINSIASKRTPVEEVLVTNYEPAE